MPYKHIAFNFIKCLIWFAFSSHVQTTLIIFICQRLRQTAAALSYLPTLKAIDRFMLYASEIRFSLFNINFETVLR